MFVKISEEFIVNILTVQSIKFDQSLSTAIITYKDKNEAGEKLMEVVQLPTSSFDSARKLIMIDIVKCNKPPIK